ncbi:conserved hypothetical protein, partial [Ricinus communis]
MLPAQQRLHADDAAAAQVDLGLVGERQFVACERAAQVVLQGARAHAPLCGLVRTRESVALRLGVAQRRLRVDEQRLGVESVGAETAVAHRHTAVDHAAGHLHGTVQRAVQGLRPLGATVRVGLEPQQERAAPDAGRHVAGGRAVPQPARDRHEHGVAARMPVFLVDGGQVVDVDDGQQRGGVRGRAQDVARDRVFHDQAVRHPGQRVAQELLAQPGARAALQQRPPTPVVQALHGVQRGRAQLDQLLDHARQLLEHQQVLRCERARHVVDGAQRPDAPAAAAQGHAGIEADERRPGNVRIVRKARVARRVLHHERLVVQHGPGAERDVARRLLPLDAAARLEPLAVAVHEGDDAGGD